jgi:hypothetical protein
MVDGVEVHSKLNATTLDEYRPSSDQRAAMTGNDPEGQTWCGCKFFVVDQILLLVEAREFLMFT